MDPRSTRRAARAGARAAVPLALAVFPFGLVHGVAAGASRTGDLVGVSASWLILAGAAQLSMLDLIDAHAAWAVVVATGLVINARFALYSAALAPAFAAFPGDGGTASRTCSPIRPLPSPCSTTKGSTTLAGADGSS